MRAGYQFPLDLECGLVWAVRNDAGLPSLCCFPHCGLVDFGYRRNNRYCNVRRLLVCPWRHRRCLGQEVAHRCLCHVVAHRCLAGVRGQSVEQQQNHAYRKRCDQSAICRPSGSRSITTVLVVAARTYPIPKISAIWKVDITRPGWDRSQHSTAWV